MKREGDHWFTIIEVDGTTRRDNIMFVLKDAVSGRREPSSHDVNLILRSIEMACSQAGIETFERVRVFISGPATQKFEVDTGRGYRDMFVDENSFSKMMPINDLASAIYANNSVVNMGAKPESVQPIRGPAVLFDDPIWV